MNIETPVEENTSKIKFKTIPLITTRPDVDLGLILILFPFWWFLGVEQFIFPILFIWVIVKILIIKKGRFIFPNALIIFSLFLLSQIFSALFALSSESIETWFVFIRNFVTFLTGFLILLIIVNSEISWRDTKRLILTSVLILGFIAALGIAAIFGILKFEFQSPISSLFPKWFLESDAAQRFTLRSFGRMASFFSYEYFRLTMLFSFPTLYATVIVAGLPLSMYSYAAEKRKFAKFLYLFISIFLAINLLFTTARAAIVSTLIGFIYFQVVEQKKRKVLKWGLIVTAFLIITIFILLNTSLADAVYELFAARSTSERLVLYEETIRYWLEKPIFGWATARRLEGTSLTLPLGSHSYYFAILFRFGLVGFIIFCFKYMVLWVSTKPLVISENDPSVMHDMNLFLQYGRWAIISIFFDGIATIPITDMSTMVFVWIILGLLLNTRRLAIRKVFK